ncbi:MAG: hypothetical protein HC837_06355 [Chloroflexaceae bacterium]|nr:hypothetical protein [Chloroflexaceae bacterium]
MASQHVLQTPPATALPWWVGPLQLVLALIAIGALVARLFLPALVGLALLVPPLLLLGWLGWRWQQRRRLLTSPLEWPILLCAVVLVVSSLFGVADGTARMVVLISWAAGFVVIFMAMDVLAHGWSPRVLVQALMLVISGVLLGAGWYLVAYWMTWLQLWQAGDALMPAGYRLALDGLMQGHPNTVAMVINVGVPLVVVTLWQTQIRLIRWLAGSWLALAVVVLFFSSSRGAWLATVAVVGATVLPLVWSMYRSREWSRLRWTVGLTLGYALLFLSLFLWNVQAVASQRGRAIGPDAPQSVQVERTVRNLTTDTGRRLFWERALSFWGEAPLFGVGPGGFDARYLAMEPRSRAFRATHAHSIYLTTLSETGLAGTLALVTLVGSAGWWRWRSRAALADDERVLVLGCLTAGLGMVVHGLVDTYLPLTSSLILLLLVVALAPGGCWRLAPAAGWRWFRWMPHPVHMILVLSALLAWTTYMMTSRQYAEWRTLREQTRTALQQNDLDEAWQRANRAIALAPHLGPAYSDRATVLAWQALFDPALLPLALEAQAWAQQHDPGNHAIPLNRAALLMQMQQYDQARAEAHAFEQLDTGNWVYGDLLLALLAEQQGDLEQAAPYWQQVLRREPLLFESMACQGSAVCAERVPPTSAEYAAIREARHLRDRPEQADLDQLWHLADSLNRVDLWALGALIAQEKGDTGQVERFLTAARDQSQQIGSEPTPTLALALLRDAMEREDLVTMRQIVQQQVVQPDMQLVPQLTLLLVTPAEQELVATAQEAAALLNDPQLLEQTSFYTQLLEQHTGDW